MEIRNTTWKKKELWLTENFWCDQVCVYSKSVNSSVTMKLYERLAVSTLNIKAEAH